MVVILSHDQICTTEFCLLHWMIINKSKKNLIISKIKNKIQKKLYMERLRFRKLLVYTFLITFYAVFNFVLA